MFESRVLNIILDIIFVGFDLMFIIGKVFTSQPSFWLGLWVNTQHAHFIVMFISICNYVEMYKVGVYSHELGSYDLYLSE